MAITTDDYVAISDLLGRYCWTIDEGDEDAWCALWTQDGFFSGVTPEPAVGHDALRQIVRMAWERGSGRIRHLYGSLTCDYGQSRDIVLSRYYNLVSFWKDGGKLRCLGLTKMTLVRNGDSWLIQRNESEVYWG